MPSSREDDYSERKRRRHSDSRSPSRRRHHDDYDSSRKHTHRSSGKDSPRRHSRSPSTRSSHRREYERRHPVRSDRAEDSHDDQRRHRHRSPEERERSHRRHRDHDSHRDRDCHRDRDKNRDRRSRRHRSSSRSRSRSPIKLKSAPARSKAPLPSQQDAYKTELTTDDAPPQPEKEKPNFANSGRLAAESNTVTVNGDTVVLKYHEPPEARKAPAKEAWRLYVFKGKDLLEMVELNERSCWLIGRERLVVDFPLDHPSCSKQHAAIQFRFIEKRNEFGDRIGKVKPYVIDLESANGSKVNGDLVPGGRYIELRDKDMLQFGNSSREYVLMLAKPD